MEKIWTASEIKVKLQSGNSEWLTRSLMALYDRQTASEKLAMTTTEDNKVGFSGFDAEILSSFAEQWRRNGWLSPKQFEILTRRLPKYSKQLASIAEEKRISSTLRGGDRSQSSVSADASDTPVVNGIVKFPNGAEIHCQDLAPQYDNEGEIAAWVCVADDVTYTLVND